MLDAKTLRKMSAFPLGRWFPLTSLLKDPEITIVPYPSDSRWSEHKISPHRTVGFDPWGNKLFTSANSPIFQWIENPETNPRRLNPNDRLVTDILFLIHDYLHIRFYRWAESDKELSPLLAENLRTRNHDFLATLHLASEAVATVGLDYWILAGGDLNRKICMGTALKNFAVPFDNRQIPEIRRYLDWPREETDLLSFIAEVYWTGRVPGRISRGLIESPIVSAWLEKELGYGRLQRQYTQDYLRNLFLQSARRPSEPSSDRLSIAHALRRFSKILWNWSKRNKAFPRSAPTHPPSIGFRRKVKDFRFGSIGDRSAASTMRLMKKNKLFAKEIFFQFLASREFRPSSQKFVDGLVKSIQSKDWEAALRMISFLGPALHGEAYPDFERHFFLVD